MMADEAGDLRVRLSVCVCLLTHMYVCVSVCVLVCTYLQHDRDSSYVPLVQHLPDRPTPPPPGPADSWGILGVGLLDEADDVPE